MSLDQTFMSALRLSFEKALEYEAQELVKKHTQNFKDELAASIAKISRQMATNIQTIPQLNSSELVLTINFKV